MMNIWQKQKYIPFLLSMMIIGIAQAASVPLITLFLVEEIHVQPAVAGIFFLTALVSPIVSITTGRISDKLRTRKFLIAFSAIWLATGWVLMSLIRDMRFAILIGLLFFCLTGTISAQIFSLLRDMIDYNKEKYATVISSTVRAAFSLGWVVGPIIGSWLAFTVNIRITFIITACFYVISLVPLWFLEPKVTYSVNKSDKASLNISSGVKINIICFAAVCILVLCGDAIKTAYLPIYIVEGLKQNIVVYGSIISISAILELLLMPLFGILADKFGLKTMMIVGELLGIVEYILLANSTQLWQLYVALAIHAGVISAFYGLGINYAQQILRKHTGLASSIFFGASSLAFPIGSLIGSYSLILLGVPHVFFLPLVTCILALILLFLGNYAEGVMQKSS